MKYLSLLLIVILGSCNNNRYPGFNNQLLWQKTHFEKGMIVSCFRCGCVEDLFYELKLHPDKDKNIPVIMDSACSLNNRVAIYNLPQENIDSIFLRNYNIIFFKKIPGEKVYDLKLIKSQDNIVKEYEIFYNVQ